MSESPQKTIFIVGAGASKEVNLPIGSELRKEIADVLKWTNETDYSAKDNIINDALKGKYQQEALFKACEIIRRAMAQASSIDNFLDVHSNNEEIKYCGKLAIVRTILEAESKSRLKPGNYEGIFQIKHDEIEDTWFNMFFQQVVENCGYDNLINRMKSVIFIIFNYDRCIEHYLYYAFQNYYAISSSETIEVLQHIKFYHPYGTVGSLPWQNKQFTIDYGAAPTGKQLTELATQIKTFTEGIDEPKGEISTIRYYMKNFRRLVFLGFAFHEKNMELLLPITHNPQTSHNKKIYATGVGISSHDKDHIIPDLCNRFGIPGRHNRSDDIALRGHSCYELLQQYKRGLSFV